MYKSLENNFRKVKGITGATILGDGRAGGQRPIAPGIDRAERQHAPHQQGHERLAVLNHAAALQTARARRRLSGLDILRPGREQDATKRRVPEERRRRQGDCWVLNGEKNSVSFLNADVFYVFARTEPASRDWRGLSAFLNRLPPAVPT